MPPELQSNKDAVKCAARGPRTPSKKLTQTLIVGLIKKHFFAQILDCEKSSQQNLIDLLTRPGFGPVMLIKMIPIILHYLHE